MISPVDRAFKLAPKALDGVGMEDALDVLTLAVGNSPVLVAERADLVVARKLIRGDRRPRLNAGLDQRRQGLSLDILHDLRPDLPAALGHAENDRLSGRPAPALPLPLAADVGFVGLDDAAQSPAAGLHHKPDLLCDPPSAFVSNPKLAHKLHRRDAVLGLAHEVYRMEPKRQGRRAFMEDSPRCRGDMPPAPRADIIAAVRNRIVRVLMAAIRASDSLRILIAEDCRQASLIVGVVFSEVFDRVFHALSIAGELSVVKG